MFILRRCSWFAEFAVEAEGGEETCGGEEIITQRKATQKVNNTNSGQHRARPLIVLMVP